MYPDARTLIDIGGHDARVMIINEQGKLNNFIMNDKCAAGTGRFLEVMAKALELDVTELKDYEAKAEGIINITSPCTVFAESEVMEKLAEGADIPSLVRGICTAVGVKAAALVKKLGVEAPVYMCGGVARNTGVVKAMESELGVKITASSIQQLNGAYGAAVYAYNRLSRTHTSA
jgi:predicted CoA-substrate-specific enzyme activase